MGYIFVEEVGEGGRGKGWSGEEELIIGENFVF